MVFACPHYKRNDEFHRQRLEVVAKLVGVRYGNRLSQALDDLVSSTPGMPADIYRHSLKRDCQSGDCFVTKYLPALIRAADEAVQEELSGSVHVLSPDDISTRRYDMIVDDLKRLEIVGRCFDEANARSAKKTEAREKVRNKLDLYRVASENHEAVKALIDFQTEVTSRLLLEYAPFLAKIYLSTLAHNPSYASILSDLSPERKGYEAQKYELEELVNTEGTRVRLRKQLRSEAATRRLTQEQLVEDAKLVFDAQVEAVKNYSMLQLIRLGALYIRPIRGTFSDGQRRQPIKGADFSPEDMELIYDEMSNISNAIISNIYTIAEGHLQHLYGMAYSGFSLLLGGANARKEFPSFDYDGMAVYKEEGETTGGVLGKITHRGYFNKLFNLIIEIANDVGHHFDTDFSAINLGEAIGLKEGDDLVHPIDEVTAGIRKSSGYESRTAMSTLFVAAGDEDLGNRLIEVCKGKSGDRDSLEDHLAWRVARREYRKKKYSGKWYNVKRSSGGLRDINDAIWIDNAANSRFERNMLRGIDNFPLTQSEGQRLKESYFHLINLRIRLDFYYGRNEKNLPLGKELENFVKALGYEGDSAVADFKGDYKRHRRTVRTLTDKAIDAILEGFPRVPDRVKQLQEEYASSELEEINRRIGIARAREAQLKEKIEKDSAEMQRLGRSPFTSSLWARRAASEEGLELD